MKKMFTLLLLLSYSLYSAEVESETEGDINQPDEHGRTQLHQAIREAEQERVTRLLATPKIDVNGEVGFSIYYQEKIVRNLNNSPARGVPADIKRVIGSFYFLEDIEHPLLVATEEYLHRSHTDYNSQEAWNILDALCDDPRTILLRSQLDVFTKRYRRFTDFKTVLPMLQKKAKPSET